MEAIWYSIISLMMATYVVLDGFDFGAGILHLIVAKNDEERRIVLSAIGPLWDGNEVWLLAGGGLLFFSFPRAYSAGFGGFYLPLTMVLWLLILRGVSIEFRSLEKSPLWRSFWDGTFFLASILMAIVLGAAIGNVIRGVPIQADGFFAGPLFTNFMPGSNPGVLDWYTVLVGVFALCVLAMHGGLYLRMKTEGEVQARASKAAAIFWVGALVVGIGATIATDLIRPELYRQLGQTPWAWALVALFLLCFLGIPYALKRMGDGAPFLLSVGFVALMLASTAAGLYPVLLRSTVDPSYSLTADNASAGALSLQVGLYWWVIAIVIAIGYFVYLFRTFKGKVTAGPETGHA